MRPLFALLLSCAPAFAGGQRSAPASARSGAIVALPAPVIGAGAPAAVRVGVDLPTLPTQANSGAVVFDGEASRPNLTEAPGANAPGATASGRSGSGSHREPQAGLVSHEPAAAEPKGDERPPAPPAPEPPRPPGNLRASAPAVVTAMNLVSGLGAILLAANGAVAAAAGLILLANVFDMLDGRVARALGVSSELGVELDSLADVVSFGAAPAVLAYHAALAPLGPVGFAAAAAFAAAGMYRLARFNTSVFQEKMGKTPPKPGDHFTGMPIPAGAGVLTAAVLAAPLLGAAAPGVVAAVAGVAALAMVSRLPYPAFKKGGLRALALPAAVAAAASAAVLLAGGLALVPAALFGLYLLTGPGVALWTGSSDAFKRELKRKAFHQLTLLYLPAYRLIPDEHRLWAFGAWAALVAAVELARLKSARLRPFFDAWFGGIIREKEAGRFSGSFYATLGVLATVALWGSQPLVVAGALLALALGDAASPLVGLRWGVGKFKIAGTKRSLDGALAGFAAALLIALALGFSPLVAAGAALVFSAVDLYPVKPDDNLWIPVAFGTALALLPRLLV